MGAVASVVMAAAHASIKGLMVAGAILAAAASGALLWKAYTIGGWVAVAAVCLVAALAARRLTRQAVVPVMHSDPKSPGAVRVVAVSDTHCKHDGLQVPHGDVLVCAGDFTRRGTVKEIMAFNTWLGSLPHAHKVVVAGNHDLLFDSSYYNANWRQWTPVKEDCHADTARNLLTNATHYLEHEEAEVAGLRIFGSPYQPCPKGREMAFQYKREDAQHRWRDIPAGLDVLITHGPPKGICDTFIAKSAGCPALLERVAVAKPQFHVFGHIHTAYGVEQRADTTFINAACVTMRFKAAPHRPVVFDVVPRQR